MKPMKVLLLGSNGQLGWELQRTCPGNIDLVLCDFPKVDFLSSQSIKTCIDNSEPDIIINSAAYTAVDKAETEKDLAFKINHDAVIEIANLCLEISIKLIQISTDFVFDGFSYRPYSPEDRPNPLSVYGASKLEGEKAALEILKGQSLIIRTAWLYSSHGTNFVKTMLSLMKQKKELNVIDEQIGTPTWAFGLANAIWLSVQKQLTGIYHWTDAGVASWYDFAVAIQEEALMIGILERTIPVCPVKSNAFLTQAERPFYSVLDKESFWQELNIHPEHWRSQLRKMLKDLV